MTKTFVFFRCNECGCQPIHEEELTMKCPECGMRNDYSELPVEEENDE